MFTRAEKITREVSLVGSNKEGARLQQNDNICHLRNAAAN